MSARQLIVLGTASQAPTRYRHHNSLVVRWDDALIMFDPGEGTQRQAILAGVSIPRLSAVCITHFHGDHCLGLPGVIQRRALDNRDRSDPPPLPVFFPGDDSQYFDRLRSASLFHDRSEAVGCPITSGGRLASLGSTTVLSAHKLDHRVATYGYRIDEPDHRRLDRSLLAKHGIDGPDVGRLVDQGWLQTDGGLVRVEDVSSLRRGQSMAVVMDTRPCENAYLLADGVDMLVCEATFHSEHGELAAKYAHMTALDAGKLARRAGVRRLVLTHFSARYSDPERLGDEARTVFDDVVVAKDLMTVAVPPRTAT